MSTHKNAPRARFAYLRTGRKPVAGVDYRKDLKGPGQNIPKDNRSLAIAADDRVEECFRWWQERATRELTEIGVHGTEFGSATYDTTHVVTHQQVQADPRCPAKLRRDLRTLLDWWFWVYALCSSPDRSVVPDPERLKRGRTCTPPGQRMIYRNGKPTRSVINRTNVSWAWNIMARYDYVVKRPDPSRPSTSGAELDCMCLEEMARGGTLYYPEMPARKDLEQVRLAMPFEFRPVYGLLSAVPFQWLAQALRPYDKNPNNKAVESAAGSPWLDVQNLGDVVGILFVDSLAPIPQPPPRHTVSVNVEALKMREGQLRDLAEARHTRAATRTLALDIANAMKRWRGES